MVSLMDRLLKLENLDLQLTPYRVLATGQDEGMVEFVPSTSLAQVRCVLLQYMSYIQFGDEQRISTSLFATGTV